jgi:peptidoglycan/xylan/chitin deacetylase (PgdA/CDA1 family)
MNDILFEIPIVTYHKICYDKEFGINVVWPSQFQRHMKYLHERKFHPITFIDIVKGNIPSNPIIITFDDGYQSIFDYALPILQKYHFRAVIYIITNFIGKYNLWDAKLSGNRFMHLNQEEIYALHQAGMEIGSHGKTHRGLIFLNREDIESELSESFEFLKDLTHQRILSIAYPFGLQNNQIQQIARKVGYHFGCINLWGVQPKNNPFCLKRIPVYRIDNLNVFHNKLSNGWKRQIEILKLKILSSPAIMTPLYQKYIKKFKVN